MTQHGSFPGRPRGRRARHQADVPEGEGYPAPPQDEREFPDLSPIRPRDARPRDGRGPGDWHGQQAQPGQYGPPDQYGQPDQYGGEYRQCRVGNGPARPPGYGGSPPRSRRRAVDRPAGSPGSTSPISRKTVKKSLARQHGRPVRRRTVRWRLAGQVGGPAPAGGKRPSRAAPGTVPASRSGRRIVQPQRPRRSRRGEEDVPSWAEPDSVEAFSARWHRRGLDSRDDRRSARRSRRRWLIAGGGVAAVVIAVAVYFLTQQQRLGQPGPGIAGDPVPAGRGAVGTRRVRHRAERHPEPVPAGLVQAGGAAAKQRHEQPVQLDAGRCAHLPGA